MKAKLTKIGQPKASRNGDTFFTRLSFMLEDGSFAQTDVCPVYRNFTYWKPVIDAGPGTWIDNVTLKGGQKIDADSQVRIVQAPLMPAPGQMAIDKEIAVRSRTVEGKEYKIVMGANGPECSCPGFQYRKTCKHVKPML